MDPMIPGLEEEVGGGGGVAPAAGADDTADGGVDGDMVLDVEDGDSDGRGLDHRFLNSLS